MRMKIRNVVDEPVPFSGTAEEAHNNYNTHDWSYDEGDTRCIRCDASVRHRAASYPCGTEPPRRVTMVWEDGNGEIHTGHPTFAKFGISGEG